MNDPWRLVFYLIIGLVWFFISAKRQQGGDPEEKPWEELPPVPRPRRAPTTPVPTGTAEPPKRITIGPRKQPPVVAAPAVAVASVVQTFAAERAKAPLMAVPLPAADAPSWSLDFSSHKGIAEGIILSAILGPPKASAYLRRVTRYWGASP